MTPQAAFAKELLQRLERVGIPYMISGSWASGHYGERRPTQDIDVVLDPTEEQLRRFVALLEPRHYFVQLESMLDAWRRRSIANIIDYASGDKADLVFLKADAFERTAFRQRRKVKEVFGEAFYISPEDSILSKLRWAKISRSEQQHRDVFGVLAVQGPNLDFAYLRKWADELGVRLTFEDILAESKLMWPEGTA